MWIRVTTVGFSLNAAGPSEGPVFDLDSTFRFPGQFPATLPISWFRGNNASAVPAVSAALLADNMEDERVRSLVLHVHLDLPVQFRTHQSGVFFGMRHGSFRTKLSLQPWCDEIFQFLLRLENKIKIRQRFSYKSTKIFTWYNDANYSTAAASRYNTTKIAFVRTHVTFRAFISGVSNNHY